MDYRKEQTFIVAYDDNNNMRGKWNITNNTYIGVRGNAIKSVPVAFQVDKATDMPRYISSAISIIRMNNSAWRPFNSSRAKRMEQLISLGIVIDDEWTNWNFIEKDSTRLTKEVVNFLRNNCDNVYNERNIRLYTVAKKYQGLTEKCHEQMAWAVDVLQHLEGHSTIPTNFIEGMVVRGVHEKVFTEYNAYSMAQIIINWYNYTVELGDKLEVKHNILTNYCILKYLRDQFYEEHYDEVLNRNNNKPWLYYENDEYIVRPLLTREEFHKEAEAQNNCVERMYMEHVHNGQTHVVVVRKKNDPDHSYITCEVRNDGEIWQYLLRFNQRTKDEKDNQFKIEYQNHLKDALKE